MISIADIEILHNILIEKYGGATGIRDMASLESAIARPFQTFDYTDLYPTVIEKAASLIESILINHPFVDGNKRTGYVLMRLFLNQRDIDLNSSEEEKYVFTVSIASGQLKYDGIVEWIKANSIDIS